MKIITFDERGEATEKDVDLNKLPEWTEAQEIGYEPKTDWWDRFGLAELCGPGVVENTFMTLFSEARKDVVKLAELALILNHRGFLWCEAAEFSDNDAAARDVFGWISSDYFNKFRAVDDWAHENLDRNDFEIYFRVVD